MQSSSAPSVCRCNRTPPAHSIRDRIARALLALSAVFAAFGAGAEVVEEVITVPVSVSTIYGQPVAQDIHLTIWRDATRARSPFLVLNHGRPANAAAVAIMPRQRYAENAQYLVARGFVVLIPTRAGYGPSNAGTDVEYSGPCQSREYPKVFDAAAEQTIAVLKHAKSLSYVDTSRGIVVGQSFGGATAIAIAAKNVDGVAAAVNFGGGSGGNPEGSPERPCRPDQLERAFRDYARSVRVPTLWLYSENDRYWGRELPKKWFDAFVAAGGRATFIALPPFRTDGHASFTGNPAAWKPAFEAFLKDVGF